VKGLSGFIDASGAALVTGATVGTNAGFTAAAIRRRVQTVLLYEKGASSIPATLDPSPALGVTDYAEALFYAVIINGAGSPSGVAVTVQVGDAVNALWTAHPQGVVPINAGVAGPNAIFGLAAVGNLGDLVRLGISATTPWTSGTVQLWAKLKG